MHTSASLTLNENWDPDVREDMEMFLTSFVPENLPFRHTCEGPDDMPAHVKVKKCQFCGSFSSKICIFFIRPASSVLVSVFPSQKVA